MQKQLAYCLAHCIFIAMTSSLCWVRSGGHGYVRYLAASLVTKGA